MPLRVRHTDTIRIPWWMSCWTLVKMVVVVASMLFLLLAAAAPTGTLAFSGTVMSFRPRSKQLLVQSTRCWSTSTPSHSDPMGDDTPPVSLLPPSSSTLPQPPSLSRRTVLRPVGSSVSTRSAVTSTTESKQPSQSLGLIVRSAANWASLFCVVDCTLLPLVSLLLPLLGWMNLGSSSSAAASAMQVNLCAWMHGLALYFVLPVGTTTVTWNYWTGHRNAFVAGLGVLGLTLVGLANIDLVPPIFHHGTTTTTMMIHRIINVLGCLLLLGSNVLSQQLGCDCGIPFCKPMSGNKMDLQRGAAANNHPLLVSSTTSSTTTTTATTTAMSFQTKMIQHKQQQQQLLLLQQTTIPSISRKESSNTSAGGPIL